MSHQHLATFRNMERGFRLIGHYQGAVRAQRIADVIESGDEGHIDEYRWYDRGSSEMPDVGSFELGVSGVLSFPPITVALRRDQMIQLWGRLTQVLFPEAIDIYNAVSQLVSQQYRPDGSLILR